MMKNIHLSTAALALVAGTWGAPAAAAPVAFSIADSTFVVGSGYGTDANETTGTLLDVAFAANGGAQAFSLTNLGDSMTFAFGTVTLLETGLILPAETDDLGVAAVFNFDDPLNGLRSIVTTGVATVGLVNDIDIDYSIDWNPVTVDFGNGGQFTIDMNSINLRGTGGSRTEFATIMLVTMPVPEPATLSLVSLALVGLGWSQRTRRS